MEKILSVCIPTYNMEVLLSRCLNSFIIDKEFLEQIEIIVVNDGSRDDSLKIAKKFNDSYPSTFIVIDKPNGNYGSCINAALKVARGKYFRICDADDRYNTEALKDYISYLQATKCDLVFSPYEILDSDSKTIYTFKSTFKYIHKTYDIEDVKWMEFDLIKYRAMHALCVKTDILKQNGYKQTEGISYTDTEFVFYSILYSKTCSFFLLPIYFYYLGRDGQTMSKVSMVNSVMHFYKNAKRMLDDYIALPQDVGEEKQGLLFRSLMACVHYFAATSIVHIRKNKKLKILLEDLITESNKSLIKCPIEECLLKERYYRLWKRYHVPSLVFYYFYNR